MDGYGADSIKCRDAVRKRPGTYIDDTDAGLEPDEYVVHSAADIAAGLDPAMARALEAVA